MNYTDVPDWFMDEVVWAIEDHVNTKDLTNLFKLFSDPKFISKLTEVKDLIDALEYYKNKSDSRRARMALKPFEGE